MTRFVCIGDAHFGRQGARNADRYAALDQIIRHGEQLEHLGAWLWPGDIFDAKSLVDDRNAIAARLQRMAQLAPVVLCYGNHDHAGDLHIFERLQATYPIHVADQPKVIMLSLATRQRGAIACVPYLHRGGLVSAGVEHGQLGAVAESLLDPIFLSLAADLEDAERHGAIGLVMGHTSIGGAVASNGQPQIGLEVELTPGLLARFGDRLKIWNHIHKAQTVHGVHYVGSITRQDAGEIEEKRFLVAEYAGDGSLHQLASVPIDTPGWFHIEGELTPAGFTFTVTSGGTEIPAPAAWTGHDVRVRYRCRQAEVGVLDEAHIHAAFAGCRTLKIDRVTILEHTVRAPEIAAAQTLDEKVVAYAGRIGITATDGLRRKVTALQTKDEAALLAEVSALLASTAIAPAASQAVA